MGTRLPQRGSRIVGIAAIIVAMLLAVLPAMSAQAVAPEPTAAAGPTLTITEPAPWTLTARDVIRVSGHATDENGIESVTVNGRIATIGPDGSFTLNTILNEGTNNIVVIARNTLGIETTEIVTVIADLTAPTLSEMLPAQDVTLAWGETIVVRFRSEPGLTAAFQVVLNGTDGTHISTGLPPGTPMTEIAPGLYKGTYTAPANTAFNRAVIRFGAADAVQNLILTTAPGHLRVAAVHHPDDLPAPPALTITAPAEGLITNQATVTVAGTATDAIGLDTVTVNGTEAAVDPTGHFTAAVALSEGANAITVVARNIVGRETAATLSVTRDTAGPNISLDDPTEGQVFTAPDVIVSGQIQSQHGVAAVELNGFPVSLDAAGSFAATVALAPGANTLAVTATDHLGNISAETRTVYFVALRADWDPISERNANATIPVKLTLAEPGGGTLEATQVNLRILNADGDLVATYPMAQTGNHYQVNVNGLAPGSYRLEAVVTVDGLDAAVAGPQFRLR